MSETWQPMATAPKNGAVILIWSYYGPRPAYWSGMEKKEGSISYGMSFGWNCNITDERIHQYQQPRMWMPIEPMPPITAPNRWRSKHYNYSLKGNKK